jgi:O-acetyl-ADP-ribose deacetylase (regulator of RNase III)
LTYGGNLKARYVIHAVGPRMGEGDEDRKLRKAALNSSNSRGPPPAEHLFAPSVQHLGYPSNRCARIMLKTAAEYLQNPQTAVRRIVFCLYDRASFDTFAAALEELKNESSGSH